MKVRLITESYRRKVDGVLRYYGKDAVIDVTDEERERLFSIGSAVDLDAAPEPAPAPVEVVAAAEDDTPEGDAPERPKNAANKDTWAAYYRVVKGTDPGKLTREEIIAEVG